VAVTNVAAVKVPSTHKPQQKKVGSSYIRCEGGGPPPLMMASILATPWHLHQRLPQYQNS